MATTTTTGLQARAASLGRDEAARCHREIVARMQDLGATAERERRILALLQDVIEAMQAQREAGHAFDILHLEALALEAVHGLTRPAIRAPQAPPTLPPDYFWYATTDAPIGDCLRRWRESNPAYGEE